MVEQTEVRPEIVGVVTDRDLVLPALAEGLNVRKVAVEKIMTPVAARGDPLGILSLDDVVDGLAAELSSAAALLKSERRREAAEHAVAAPR